jgi:hypothetical protein
MMGGTILCLENRVSLSSGKELKQQKSEVKNNKTKQSKSPARLRSQKQI